MARFPPDRCGVYNLRCCAGLRIDTYTGALPFAPFHSFFLSFFLSRNQSGVSAYTLCIDLGEGEGEYN